MSKDQGQEYPKTLFHKTKGSRTVRDAAAEKALGAGWQETPFPKDDEEEAAPKKAAAPSKGKDDKNGK